MLVASKYAATCECSLHLFALKDTMTGEKKSRIYDQSLQRMVKAMIG